ncbi:hypothetical protein DB346_05690 [Verrucomicrobia bacterium LW23]|nr:hypothetical protein DB346_05690 [Verrucomicrobia bacterium LW23]
MPQKTKKPAAATPTAATTSSATTIWRRTIPIEAEDAWLEKLAWLDDPGRIAMTGFVGKNTLRLEVYHPTQAEQQQLVARHKGHVLSLPDEAWQRPMLSEPWAAGKKLAIAPDSAGKAAWDAAHPKVPALLIPASMAFGSGEHGTTRMILREMTTLDFTAVRRVVDIGSGSGILALAARQLSERAAAAKEAGASPRPAAIQGFDLDPHATRIATENEAANFQPGNILWKTADLFAIRKPAPCDLVLANLYSEILVAARDKIASVVAPGGTLLLSGILQSKRDWVREAFESPAATPALRFVRQRRDGKWAMLHYTRPAE